MIHFHAGVVLQTEHDQSIYEDVPLRTSRPRLAALDASY
jgi:hypothetical protein